MNRISIPITRDGPVMPFWRHAAMIPLLLVSGILIDKFITTSTPQISLAGTYRQMIASLGGAAVVNSLTTVEKVNPERAQPASTNESTIIRQVSPSGTTQPSAGGDSTPLINTEKTIAKKATSDMQIERINRQIGLLKNSSVMLIAAFNQNCGVWTDPCAIPYASVMEQNNLSYDKLAKERDALSEAE